MIEEADVVGVSAISCFEIAWQNLSCLRRVGGRHAAEHPTMDVRHCGAEHDRDVNAALNLQRVALATGSWPERQACGEEGAGRRLRRELSRAVARPW